MTAISAEGLITIRTSLDTDKISPALVQATASLVDVHKSSKAHNPRIKYTYADLPSVLAVVRPVLINCQLACLQGQVLHVVLDGVAVGLAYDGVICATRLLHVSGQWAEAYTAMPSDRQGGPHGQGSAYTYARRYGLLALLGISATDDDAQAAQQQHSSRQAPDARTGDWPASRVQPSPRDALRKLWHAKLRQASPSQLTDEERHRVQRAIFGCASLNEIPEDQIRGWLDRLRHSDLTRLQGFISKARRGDG